MGSCQVWPVCFLCQILQEEGPDLVGGHLLHCRRLETAGDITSLTDASCGCLTEVSSLTCVQGQQWGMPLISDSVACCMSLPPVHHLWPLCECRHGSTARASAETRRPALL